MSADSRRGKIHRLEILNFKSYKGRTTIGPFTDFTAVIGPNGAGKSNLMDAISFVLGVRATHLRGNQLKDLIYRVYEGGEASEASVLLAFRPESEDEEEGEEEILFQRTINRAGASTYSINGSTVPWDDYNKKLQGFGILVKARNFLVFQGDVESIASKSPKELTKLFEQISGSDRLKKQYDRLLEEKEKAEENTIFNFQRRKGISAEKKQYKEQKDEAERFNALLAEKRKLQLEHILFQLFHIERKINRSTKKVDEENSNLRGVEDRREMVSRQLKSKKKEQAGLLNESSKIQNRLNKVRKEIEQRDPQLIQVSEEINRITRRSASAEADRERMREELEQQQRDIESLETDLEALQQRSDEFEEDLRKKEGEEKLVLQADQLAEYNAMKEEAGRRTTKLKQDLEGIQRQQKLDQDRKEAMEAKLEELRARKRQLEETESQFERRQSKVEEFINQSARKKDELEESLASISASNKQAIARQEELMKLLEGIQEELKEAKVDVRSSERETRFKEAIDSMQRLFPGVYGRMLDLVEPTARKYNVAMTVVMGRNMDAIVVDSEKIALECILYLREQRIGTATFIPLDSIKVKPVNERLRNQLATGGTETNLLIDVIQYDPAIQKAILYAIGNTVVTSSMDEARRLAFKQGIKTVTLNGTLVRKSGLMTGGPGGVQAQARRWDQKKIEALKRNRDKYLKELAEVGKDLRAVSKEQQLQTQIAGLEERIKNFKIDLGITRDKLSKCTEEKEDVDRQIRDIEPKLDSLREATEEREASMDAQLREIQAIEDEIFSDFSRRVGVRNIREYEEKRQAFEKEKTEKRLQFSTQISLLKNRLEYERRKDLAGPLKKLEERIDNDRKALKQLQKQQKNLQAEHDELQEKFNSINEEKQKLKSQIDDLETEIKELKKELNNLIQTAGAAQKQITARETEIEQLKMRRHAIYQRCKVEQIPLPRKGEGREEGEVETPSVEFPSAEMELESQAVREMVEKEDEFEIDFDQLDPRLRQIRKRQDEDRENQRFSDELALLTSKIEKIAPNLKAIGHFDEVMERLSKTDKEFAQARERAKRAADEFDRVKLERYKRFMQAYEHISERIDEIYKALTMSHSHVGGTAFLNLEHPEEPYLHGIKYNAMPPLKRFRDIEQLSGGEKTVAALALLFAIHTYKPSPFFVLDEVDAALDNHNIAKVVRYMRRRVEETGLQCIVISLKDSFYAQADSLIGIYRDQDKECSGTATILLADFPE